ncbi:hypothetical protein BN7_1628 [Wickerhamomyces ciferrii]|uniref:Uncharacterized protein n=1 Tax=Wickerhamomyces ciferrii (strain ATCC 14091 / BCRC 22168 / CBS 111 / JCM 3599 / NBRC 0793 / NRRL Y-1031 F-60-10) TaxID=1206466 RepID=K0KGI2_WICCF|nr:uncharacterized protein BN7_1628 [Wickerhamomyces ciferrii]CCH42086.1 hypothetical protein BN7_1628 [Wickerhamomyces ciferrii]
MSRLRRTLTLSNYRVERKLAKFREIEKSSPMLPVLSEIHYKNGYKETCKFIYNQPKKKIEDLKIGDDEPNGLYIYKFFLDRTGGLHTFTGFAIESMNDLEKGKNIFYYMDPRCKQFLKDRTFINQLHKAEFKHEFAPKSNDTMTVYNAPFHLLVDGYLQEQAIEIELYEQLKRSEQVIAAVEEEDDEEDDDDSAVDSDENTSADSESTTSSNESTSDESASDESATNDATTDTTSDIVVAAPNQETSVPAPVESSTEVTPTPVEVESVEVTPTPNPDVPTSDALTVQTQEKSSEVLAESFQLLGQAFWKFLIVLGMFLSQNSTHIGTFFKFLLKMIILLLAYLLQCLYIGLKSNESKNEDNEDKEKARQSISFNF